MSYEDFEEDYEDYEDYEDDFICSVCGEFIESGDVICPFCGSPL